MSYKLVDLEQGTEDWKKWRRFKIGASDIAAIMNESPWKTRLGLWEEIIEGKEAPESPAMRRGKELEPIARDRVNGKLGTHYEPRCLESTLFPYFIASLDGFDPQSSIPILEIKNGSEDLHNQAKRGKIPEHYQWQIQGQINVANQESARYCSFFDDEEVILEVKRKESMIEKIREEGTKFYEQLMEFEPPAPCDQDIIVVGDEDMLRKMKEYEEIETKMKSDEKELKRIKAEIVSYLEKNDIKRAKIWNTKTLFVKRKGNVQYDSIPELQGVDLMQFRGAPSQFWSFVPPRMK